MFGAIYGDVIGSYYEIHCTKNYDFPFENDSTFTDGSRLIVFRDSFGSSPAPLLAARYIDPYLLSRYMRFENADVLFLYSATLLNDSQGVN